MKKYNTLIKINRPIKFLGLSALQFTIIALFGAMIIIVLVFKKVHPLLLVLSILGMVLLFTYLFKELKKQQKRGNPDYLQGVIIKRETPKQITDRNFLFRNLIRTWK